MDSWSRKRVFRNIRDENKINETLKMHYNAAKSLNYNVFGTFLQGSQNYDLDYEGSDIDTKTIIIPTIDDIVLNSRLEAEILA